MVHLIIDNLLSTSKNRPLMEALWFLSISRNGRPEKSSNVNFDNCSIAAICNELKTQINNEETDARKFFFSTQLVFGILQLYKIQIDKLYDQSRLIVQTWNSSIFNQNWLLDMSQINSQQEKSVVKHNKKKTVTSVKKSKKSNKENVIPDNILDDLELMENIFKIPADNDDFEEEILTYLTSTNKKENVKKKQVLADQTIVDHVKNITLHESNIAASSGYHTFINDEEDFGESSGYAFKNLLKDTEALKCKPKSLNDDSGGSFPSFDDSETNLSKLNASLEIDDILTTLRHSKPILSDNCKPRRLTYSDLTADVPRNTNNEQDNHLDIYDMTNQKEFTTFDDNANVMEISKMTDIPGENIHLETMPEILIDVTQNQTVPNVLQKTMLPQTEIENELVLDKLDLLNTKRKRSKKTRMLVIDKLTTLSDSTIKKNNETYTEKHTKCSPFQSFQIDMFYIKNCADTLFASTSLRMNNSNLSLVKIYKRNMVTLSENFLKKRKATDNNVENEISSQINEPSPPKKAKILHSRKRLFRDDTSKKFKDITPAIEETAIDNSKISTSLVNQHIEMQAFFDMEIDLPPIIDNQFPNQVSLTENDCSSPEKKRKKTNVKQQQQHNKSSSKVARIEGSEQDKQVILSKLKKLWTMKPKQPITMSKLCIGQNRFEAAKTFFELLVLSKTGVIELIQNETSLEICNIRSKISK
ncbi:hypothetical protein PVAND_006461 [Polypedilum vanderplanki]|uniref:Rad21/Rec8-like protein C-terminal eukaryotic domain-containing protein n=1 Tax=Polypedilum vanderplanki TaxID=319348 RepID=A0A9J6C3Q2_POLVA|nr:hypothetical protein PVAND_006461 [Polypedilum vanderplanki]